MLLTKHQTTDGTRWAVDGEFVPPSLNLSTLLELPAAAMINELKESISSEQAAGKTLAPIDPYQEVWAAGVTYLRSRDARKAESTVADVYQNVYEAERPEIFFKALGWRVAGTGDAIRIRTDSRWNVPEPELVLVINRHQEIVGYCAGNDVSSRDIEGENPLYLPQAKVYKASCGLGPGIVLNPSAQWPETTIRISIKRAEQEMFTGEVSTARIKRRIDELTTYLGRSSEFENGVILLTGTGIVPPSDFTLQAGDVTTITIDGIGVLINTVMVV